MWVCLCLRDDFKVVLTPTLLHTIVDTIKYTNFNESKIFNILLQNNDSLSVTFTFN